MDLPNLPNANGSRPRECNRSTAKEKRVACETVIEFFQNPHTKKEKREREKARYGTGTADKGRRVGRRVG